MDIQAEYKAGKRDFSGVSLSYEDLSEADLRGADLRGAYLREANLSYADLRGTDLRRANLYKANLRGADLTGADLTGAIVEGTILEPEPEPEPEPEATFQRIITDVQDLAASMDARALATLAPRMQLLTNSIFALRDGKDSFEFGDDALSRKDMDRVAAMISAARAGGAG